MSTSNGDYVRIPLSGSFDDQEDLGLHGSLEHEAYVEDKKVEANHSFLTLKFYQQYFDVDTSQVLTRLATALVPNPRTNFIQHSLKPHADLYGPFWVATTLMLIAAIGGNISNYLQSRAEVPSWHYDFHKVTLTSSVIYVYWCLMPLVLYGLMHFRRNNVKSQSSDAESDLSNLLERSETDSSFHSSRRANKFFDILSAYGYSLTIYVPVVILWTIQSSILQWILFLLGLTVSGAFLVFSLTPNIRKEHPKLATPILIGLIVVHCGFSLALMIAFFHGSPNTHHPLTAAGYVNQQKPIESNKEFLNSSIAFPSKIKSQ